MEAKDIKAVYFVGAGGIGMSALVRYFIHRGLIVAGYDKTPSDLTRRLEKEGALIHPARLLCPWDCPGKNTGVGGHSLLQRIFPT